jgi:hypothetical protein
LAAPPAPVVAAPPAALARNTIPGEVRRIEGIEWSDSFGDSVHQRPERMYRFHERADGPGDTRMTPDNALPQTDEQSNDADEPTPPWRTPCSGCPHSVGMVFPLAAALILFLAFAGKRTKPATRFPMPASPSRLRCARCHHPLPEVGQFCSHCGSRVRPGR